MSDFREAFEAAAPQFIAAAWDYTDRSEAVEKLWVYVTEEDDVSVAVAFYRVAGEVHTAHEVGQAIPAVDSSPAGQNELLDNLLDVLNEMFDAVEEDQFPTRMVLSFDTGTQEMNAEFSYEPLQPGVPEDELVPDAKLADRWLERLRSTGEDSAEL
ncbi:hypothetical protein [Tessaracoccus massiliensis]|uniref:hypothetical protein n=1 Tax=Tessaracoccus massiliensis TaxID=1522311 RepID=UPI00058B6A2A|nr:hypothetical protein [Tessaracoccus massiliensis]